MSIGVILAIGAAFFESVVDVLRKKDASRFDALVASWSLAAFTFLFSLVALLALERHAIPISSEFWSALAATLVFNSIAMYLYMSVLGTAEISLVLPLVTLSPAFLLITAPLINHEFPSKFGILGIVVTVLGTYGLKYEDRAQGWWKPVTNLWKDRRNQKMLLVAFLWAWSSPFDKRAAVAASPLWFMTLFNAGLMLVYTPFMFQKRRWAMVLREKGWQKLMLFALVNTVRAWCQFTSIVYIFVPYSIGLKRLSILFGIMWGRLIFKEQNTRSRAVAASIMLAGSIMILLAALQ